MLLPFLFGDSWLLLVFPRPVSLESLGVLLVAICWLSALKKQPDVVRYLILLCADVFLFALPSVLASPGVEAVAVRQEEAIASVLESSNSANGRVRLQIRIHFFKDGDGWRQADEPSILSIKDLPDHHFIVPGQLIHFLGSARRPSPPLNPGEFNYAKYLERKGIRRSFTAVAANVYVSSQNSMMNPLRLWALQARQLIIDAIGSSNLTKDAASISTALITGYDDDISDDVMATFRHSGTLHVLSVSGLHIGLIYLVLQTMWSWLDRYKRHKFLRLVFLIPPLWAFAFMTGLAGPVLRSVIMFTAMAIGKAYFRSGTSNSINVLAFSAFVLLFIDPNQLLDIGFQLSYLAMAALLVIHPFVLSFWSPRYKVTSYVWTSFSGSIAATLATLPVTLYRFHQFPYWFLLCNLVVVPGSFLIMMLVLLMLIGIPVDPIINFITDILLRLMQVVNHPSLGFGEHISFSFTEAMLLMVFVFLLMIAVLNRSPGNFVMAAIFMSCTLFAGLFHCIERQFDGSICVFNVYRSSLVTVFNDNRLQIWSADSAAIRRLPDDYLSMLGGPSAGRIDFSVIRSGKFVLGKYVPGQPFVDTTGITHLLVTNDQCPDPLFLSRAVRCRTFILDGSNTRKFVRRTDSLCRKFGIRMHLTSRDGAFVCHLK